MYSYKTCGGKLLANSFYMDENQIISCFGRCINQYSRKTGNFLLCISQQNSQILYFKLQNNKLKLITSSQCHEFEKNENHEYKIKHSIELKFSILNCCMDKNLNQLFFLQDNQLSIFNFKNNKISFLLKIDNSFDTNSLIYISPQENYLISTIGHIFYLFDIEENKIILQFKHHDIITSVLMNNDENSLVVGSIQGKITFYNDILNNQQYQIMHWHAHQVTSLNFNDENSVLFSGGQEGVLVMWNQFNQKRDFLPRLGSEIIGIYLDSQQSEIAVLLKENSIKIIQLHNFLENLQISSIQNPQCIKTIKNQNNQIFKSGFKQKKYNIITNSLSGRLQVFQLNGGLMIKEIDILPRNLIQSDELPNPSDIVSFDFDINFKILVTITQRECDDNQMSCIRFWEEQSEFEFKLNTKIEQPHGQYATNVSQFFSQQLNEQQFVTFGSDNSFKIWKKFQKIQENKLEKNGNSQEKIISYWNSYIQGNYKNQEIKKMKYIFKNQQDCFLILTFQSLLIHNINENEIIFSYDISNLQSDEVNQYFDFDYDNEDQIIYMTTNNNIIIFDLIINYPIFQQQINMIEQMCYDNIKKQLILLILQNEQKGILIINQKSNNIQLIWIGLKILQIFLYHQDTNNENLLLGIDQDINLFILKGEEFQQININQIEIEEEKLIKKIDKKEQITYNQNYKNIIESEFRSDFKKMPQFFSKNSHLLPKTDILFNKFINFSLINNEQIQYKTQEINNQMNDSSDVDSEITTNIEINQEKKHQNQNKKMSNFFEIKKQIHNIFN